ncbi:MAG TPA: hypothetical protein VJO14_03430 [Bacteroidota bacterium]|nr:hypothetical protein [Bacteroidota bacterium]
MSHNRPELRTGDLVQVKNEEEIRATLDENGTLDALPFMPEMVKYCGKTYRVFKYTASTCVEGYGMRRMTDSVFLEGVRCDGGYHDGCQRLCLIFWKMQWLRKIKMPPQSYRATDLRAQADPKTPDYKTQNGDVYFCQSTELRKATIQAAWWDIRRDIADILYNRQSLFNIIRQSLIVVYMKIQRVIRKGDYVRVRGNLAKTPTERLGLQAGEWVEVRSLAEIKQTLDSSGKNRGLELSAEMIPFCNKKMRVMSRVNRIILEISGQMQSINDSVILEGSSCDGTFHRGCPRDNLFLWREIWLRRIDGRDAATEET